MNTILTSFISPLKCLNNGVSEADFIDNVDKITSLEMCHFNFKKISGLQVFGRHLSKLSIIAQDITEIEGLEDCLALNELWICETRVSKIKGLDHLKQLKRLFL